jgi:iduronate 2-sulfatase
MPLAAWHEGGFDNKWGKPCSDTGQNSTRVFRRAYYSAVSFTDDNIGKLLNTLDVELRLGNDTVVALMGDHGWQLGEMNEWRKVCCTTIEKPGHFKSLTHC